MHLNACRVVIVVIALLASLVGAAPASAELDLTISAAQATSGATIVNGYVTAVSSGAVVNEADLESALAAGDVYVSTQFTTGGEPGDILLDGAVNIDASDHDLAFDVAGDRFEVPGITSTGGLGVVGAGATAWLSADITVAGFGFGIPVRLLADVDVEATVGPARFEKNIDGAHALRITTPLELTLGEIDPIDVGGTDALASLELTGPARVNGSITTSGAQTYNGSVEIARSGAFATLTSASAVLAPGATFTPRVGALAGPVVGADKLQVATSVNVTGAVLAPNLVGSTQPVGTQFVIIQNDGPSPVTGVFNTLPQGGGLVLGGAYYAISYTGGDGNDVVLTRALAPTTTTVGTTPTSSGAFDSSLTLTATVTRPDGLVPSYGTVVFHYGPQGGAVVDTAPVAVNASGTASLTLPPGTLSSLASAYHVTASFSGVAQVTAASNTAAPTAYLVTKQAASLTLAQSTSTSAFGSAVTFTATLASGVPVAADIVFKDGNTTLGTRSLADGSASISVNALTVGTHSIVAVFGGTTNTFGSVSTTIDHTVQALSTSTKLVVPATAPTGAAVTFTATVAPSGSARPTGSVAFRDNGTIVGSATLNAAGVATFTTSKLEAGAHSITASYGGDSTYAGSVSTSATVMIANAAPVVTFGKLAAATKLAGVAKFGLVTVVTIDQAGTITSRLAIPAAVARKLGLLAKKSKQTKPVVVGTTTTTARVAGKVTFTSKLTARAARVLVQQRAVRLTQTINVTTPRGSRTVARTVTIKR